MGTGADYSALTDGFGTQLAAATPVALAGAGIWLGVVLGVRFVRKIIRA